MNSERCIWANSVLAACSWTQSLQADFIIVTARVSALLVVFTTFRGIRTEQRADPHTVQSPAASLQIWALHIRKYACWIRGDDSWRRPILSAVILSSTHCDPCQSSSRSSHTPPQTRSVYFPIIALCICKYARKGDALGELVTKQPEITAKSAHKVGVKYLSFYMLS